METQTTLKEQATETFTRSDIQQQVTDKIIQQLEAGTVPWQKPWKGGQNNPLSIPQNFTTGKKYRGINILLLWTSALNNDYPTQDWASFKQWQEKKEVIRKGEKGNLVVYYDAMEKEVDGEIKKIPFLKSSYVFNRSQLKSYVPSINKEPAFDELLAERIYPLEEFVHNTNAIVEHSDYGAAYIPSKDVIVMPPYDHFQVTVDCTATEGYYSTLMHELTHWTGSSTRLNRVGGKKFGDQNYAVEELVAEFGAAFLCAEFGIATIDKSNHASYINNWLQIIKENKNSLFTAASEASKAVDYLYALQP